MAFAAAGHSSAPVVSVQCGLARGPAGIQNGGGTFVINEVGRASLIVRPLPEAAVVTTRAGVFIIEVAIGNSRDDFHRVTTPVANVVNGAY